MNRTATPQEIDHDRRRFLGTATAAAITASFGLTGSGAAQPRNVALSAIDSASHTSFASLKQIEAGLLNVGYAEAGPGDGPAVILLHGWPYDIYSFVDVTPVLAAKGYRVIVPYLRDLAQPVSSLKERRGTASNRWSQSTSSL
jgi:hypothetical protein